MFPMQNNATQTIQKYYDAFNQGSMEDFFSLLTDDVQHDINQGKKEIGKESFRIFMEKMNRFYKEKVTDLTIFANQEGTLGAAEFFIEGTYLVSAPGLPPAHGQNYRLRCGTFFSLNKGKICRVTTYYNLQEWLSLIKAD